MITGAIPLPGTAMEGFDKGMSGMTDMFSKIVKQQQAREEMDRLRQMLPLQKKHLLAQMANAAAANSRAAQLQPYRLQALKNAQDPNFEMNSLMKLLQGIGGGEQGGGTPMPGGNGGGGAPQGMGALAQQPGTMDDEGLEGIGNMLGVGMPQPNMMGEGQGMMQPQAEPQQNAPEAPQQSPRFNLEKLMADNSLKGMVTKMMLHKKAPWLFKGTGKEAAFQGEARSALDMKRLADQFGEGSKVYQDAKAERDSKMQARKDLSLLRDRTNEGLKPGEKWIINEKTGEHEGIIHNSTPKEIAQEEGRIMFNEFYPLVVKGGGQFSGQESIRKFEDAASKYKTNPTARKMVDDYLLNLKVLTATEIAEAATLGSGKTNQQYSKIRESIKADDIPQRISNIVKQYQLPASAMQHAGYRFGKILNDARQKARDMVPAQRALYINPEAHAKAVAEQESKVASTAPNSDVVVIDPSGKSFTTTEANAAHLPAGWKRG